MQTDSPSYRILKAESFSNHVAFYISVSQYLDQDQLQRTICEFISNEKPKDYESLTIEPPRVSRRQF